MPNRDGTSYGSGTLVDVRGEHGLVITNWHVVHEASGPVTVVFPSGFRSQAHVQKMDQNWDLAALVIWRPSIEPVVIAMSAPQPGEQLRIAGYGTGEYREAAGACTQYLAPAKNLPFEIVEISATARQGDSGGPIFNSRDELAGVLFGEGDGLTCGSHCGRVRWFLDSVLPAVETLRQPIAVAENQHEVNAAEAMNPEIQPLPSVVPETEPSVSMNVKPHAGEPSDTNTPRTEPEDSTLDAAQAIAGNIITPATTDSMSTIAAIEPLAAPLPDLGVLDVKESEPAFSWSDSDTFELSRNILAAFGFFVLVSSFLRAARKVLA